MAGLETAQRQIFAGWGKGLGERGGSPRQTACALAACAFVVRYRVGVTTMLGAPALWQPQIGSSALAQSPTTPASFSSVQQMAIIWQQYK